jgi:hypothetical protein
MIDRQRLFRISVVLAVFGVGSILGMLSKGTFEALRLVDAVQLIGTGMCLGAALVAIILFRKTAPSK